MRVDKRWYAVALLVPLAIIVGFSQIASLFVAFTFIPALAARLLKAQSAERDAKSAKDAVGIGGDGMVPVGVGVGVGVGSAVPEPPQASMTPKKRPFYVRAYADLLEVTLRFPWASVLVVALMLGGSFYYFNKYVSKQMRWGNWASQRSTVNVRIGMPQGEELERTDDPGTNFLARRGPAGCGRSYRRSPPSSS